MRRRYTVLMYTVLLLTRNKTSICDWLNKIFTTWLDIFSTFNKFNVKALISLLWVCGIIIG